MPSAANRCAVNDFLVAAIKGTLIFDPLGKFPEWPFSRKGSRSSGARETVDVCSFAKVLVSLMFCALRKYFCISCFWSEN